MVHTKRYFLNKSVLSICLVFVLLVNMLFLGLLVSADSSKILQDFQNITSSDAIQYDHNGGSIQSGVRTEMKVRVGEPVKDAGGNITQHFGCINITPATHDWAGKSGLELYVNNTNSTEIGFEVAFETANGGTRRWMLPFDSQEIATVSGSGEAIASRVQYCSIFAPAGFKGILRIPFTAFSNGGELASNVDLTNVSMVFINFNCTVWQGLDVNLGDISLYPSGSSSTKVVENFNGMTVENIASKASAYFAYGSGSTAVISPTNESASDTALHIQGGTAASVVEPTVGIGNASGADAIRFWCKNNDTANQQLFFFQFDDSEGERFISDNGTAVFKDKNGTETTGNSFFIPAGFEGTVTIPFSSFHTRGWSGNGSIDYNLMRHIFIEITANSTAYSIDDIALVYSGESTILDADMLGDSSNIQSWVWVDGGMLSLSLNKDLSVTVGGPNPDTQASWIDLYFAQSVSNWTNMTGVEYRVKNLSSTSVKFVYGFEDGNERWVAQTGKKARYISDDGTAIIEDSTQIPANFSGVVQIPFESFGVHPYCYPVEGRDGVMNFGSIGGLLFFDFDAADNGDSLLFDDFKVIADTIDVSVPDNGGQEPGEQSRVVESFDSWTNTGKINSAFGDTLDISLATDLADSGNSLKVNIAGTETNPIGIGNRNFNLMKTNWTGAKGVEVWVHNPEATPVPVRLMFQEDSGELWLPKTDAKVALVSQDGTKQISNVIYQIVEVPGNFEGVLQMPFNSFVALEGDLKRDGVLQLNNVTKLYFEFNTVNFKGKNLYLDTVKIHYNDIDLTVPAPVDPDPAPIDEFKVIDNFDAWSNTESLGSAFGDPLDVTLASDKADSGTSLKFKITGVQSNPVGIGNRSFSLTKTNWTGAKGIQIWVHNPEVTPVPVRLMFQEDSGELWLPKTDAKVTLISAKGARQVGNVIYQIVEIPGNFEGVLQMPITSFAALEGDLKRDGVVQLGNITKFFFEFDTVNFKGKSLYLDTVKVLYNEIDISVSEPEKPDPELVYRVLEDFDLWTTNTIEERFTGKFGGSISASISDQIKDSGKGLMLTIGKKANNVDIGNIQLSGVGGNWTGAKGIQLWVSNPSNDSVALRLMFDEASGSEMWLTKTGQPVVLISSDGAKTVSVINYNIMDIPAGFKGIIQLPMTSFGAEVPDLTKDKVLQLDNISSFYFEFDCKNYSEKSLYVDTLTLLYEDVEVKEGAADTNKIVNGIKTLEDFDKWSQTTANVRFNLWADGGTVKPNVVTTNTASGKEIRFDIGEKGKNDVGVVDLKGLDSDWSNSKGVQMYVCNTEAVTVPFRFHFEEAKGTNERWITATGKNVLLCSNSGKKTISTIKYNSIDIPAGFKGYVQIPFDSFDVISWHTTGDKILQLDSVGLVFFEFDCALFSGKSLTFDNLGLVYNAINVKVQSVFNGDVRIIQDFNNVSDNRELQALIPYYVNGGMVTNTLSSKGFKGSNGMKVDVGKTNAKTGDQFSVLNIPIQETNWSDYEGVSFWVSNPSQEDLLIEIAFEEKNLERWQTNFQSRVAMKYTNGVETIKDCMPVLRIPAGFEGEMRIPFVNFKAASWSLSDNKLDLSAITTMFLIADCATNEGKSYIIDDIGIYKSGFHITTSFNKPEKLWK